MAPLVELKHIYKYFGGLCAVNDVSLEVQQGEVIGLVGDNAAGKSTLMKILSGVHRPTDGQIAIRGRQVTFRSPKDSRDVGIEMLFQIQDLAMVPELDVADNLFLGKERFKKLFGRYEMKFLLDRKTMRAQSRRFLHEIGIRLDSVTEKAKNLSGGQQQSISIARTVFFDAQLIILDEPTSSISVKEIRRVLDLILELKNKGVAVIIVSHRMDDIFSTADRIVVLRRGKKIEDVRKEETTMEAVVTKIVGAERQDMK